MSQFINHLGSACAKCGLLVLPEFIHEALLLYKLPAVLEMTEFAARALLEVGATKIYQL